MPALHRSVTPVERNPPARVVRIGANGSRGLTPPQQEASFGRSPHFTLHPTGIPLGKLIISDAMTVNGAFEAPDLPPNGWFVLDPDSKRASLEMWQAADAMVLGRRTY